MKKLLLVLLVFILFFVSLATHLNKEQKQESYVIGKRFEFSHLINIKDGSKLRLLKNKPILVHVFASWCLNCKRDLSKVMQLKKKHNLQIIGLVWQDEIKNVRNNILYNKVYDVIAYDPRDELAFEMGITGVPETFLISRDGKVVYNDKGDLQEKDLLNALQIEFSGM